MNLILLGPPGSGKGTQARLIRDHHGLVLIATGEILREEIQKDTSIGREVKEIIEAGLYPSDDIILKILEQYLRQAKVQGVILDGVPRTLNQAEKVDKMFEQLGMTLTMAIQLTVDEEELVKRLSSRRLCKSCGAAYTIDLPPRVEGVCDVCSGTEFLRRPDDAPEAVKTRFNVYNERTKLLIDYYSNTHRLKSVDGMKSVEKVNEQIEDLLRNSR
jgi:adenylate kinase